MAKKAKIPERYQIWINVRKRYHLSDAHIQMARELGLNPKKIGKIANHKQEPWDKGGRAGVTNCGTFYDTSSRLRFGQDIEQKQYMPIN